MSLRWRARGLPPEANNLWIALCESLTQVEQFYGADEVHEHQEHSELSAIRPNAFISTSRLTTASNRSAKTLAIRLSTGDRDTQRSRYRSNPSASISGELATFDARISSVATRALTSGSAAGSRTQSSSVSMESGGETLGPQEAVWGRLEIADHLGALILLANAQAQHPT